MKKSFMTRVIAVSLSAAMTFSLSAANMATASAATKYVALSAKSVTLKSGAKKTLKLKNNSLKWKVTSATSARKDVVTATKKTSSVVLKAKNCKKNHKNVKVTVKLKTANKKKNNTKKLVCKVTVKKVPTTNPDNPDPNQPTDTSIKINSATATSKTNVDVTFSGTVDRTTLVKENFKIAEDGVTVENVEVRDGISVTLTLAGAEAGKTYTLNVTGLKDANGKDVDALSTTFTMPADTTQEYYLKLSSSSEKNQIKADGYAELPIVCEVIGKDGQPITDKNYTIRFTTDRGSFSRPDIVTTNGKAENVLKSVALDVAQTAHVTAEIIRVEGTDTEEMRGKKGTIDINMTPILDSVVSNPVIGAESGYADRLTLFFQNAVEDDTYKTNGSIDSSKIKVEVFDNISAQEAETKTFIGNPEYTSDSSDRNVTGRVVNLRAVADNNRALQVLVNSPLQNNRHVGVRVQITDPTTKKTSTYVETFVLTDSETPRVLKVEPEGRRKLRVTYSEAVLPQEVATGNYRDKSADRAANYLVGGVSLDNAKWGENPDAAKLTVGSGLDGAEDRNVVTITLGKRANGDYSRFDVGSNILTAQNVGDWASMSSGVNNIITTDTKTFEVTADTTQPAIKEVEVQSPEQFLVTFNAPVDKAVAADALAVENCDEETAKNTSKNVTSIIQLQEDSKNIGANKDDADSKNPIRVTKINDEQYLVETTKDWTTVYSNLGGTNDDYFYNHKYKIVVAANKLVNINNGEKNTSEVSYDLSNEPKMRAADTTAPTMEDFSWNNTDQKATVKFSEPVKIRNEKETKGLNDEGSTPSVKQSASFEKGIQQATAQFISPKAGRTIKGKFDSFTDTTDRSVVIVPEEELTKSDDWTLHISGVSDDYGNTTTVSKTFEVTSAETGFKVAWASVSTTKKYGEDAQTIVNANNYWNAGTIAGDNGDRYIFVKFTNAVNSNSILFNASSYSINSNQIPSDAYVLRGIDGYDNNSDVVDSVTIVIPRRSAYIIDDANGGRNITLTISDRVTSSTGQTLSNLTEMALPYNHDFRTDNGDLNDAIFGDDDAETLGVAGSTVGFRGDRAAYQAAIENAIKSDKYRTIKLSADYVGDLNVSRPVNIDLNGKNIVGGTVKATFNSGATCKITGSAGSTIMSELRISTPNADWEIDQHVACENVNVRAIASKTLTNKGTITKLSVNTGSSDAKIVNETSGNITEMIIDNVSNKTIKILNKAVQANIGKVTVQNPSTIELVAEKDASGNDIPNNGVAELHVTADKGVTLKMMSGKNVGKLTGQTNDVVIKDADDKTVSASDMDIEATNSNMTSIAEAVGAKLKSEVTVTSGSGVSLANIVTKMNEDIDTNGSKISENYEVRVLVGETLSPTIIGTNRAKFADDFGLDVGDNKEIIVYVIQKDATETDLSDSAKALKVKTIKIK